jgi:hypothetical protein
MCSKKNFNLTYTFKLFYSLPATMYHLVYISEAKERMTLTTLVVILMQARALNERRDVTGALVYGDGQFMQVIEGERAVVQNLYQHIAKDPRHHHVRMLTEGPIETRRFTQWSMAFGEVPADQFQVLRRVAEYQTPEELAEQIAANKAINGLLLDKMNELVQVQN